MLYLPLVAAAISAVGQVMLKYAMNKHGQIDFTLAGMIGLFCEPRLLFALSMYAAALLMWLHVLSRVPLSTAYPMLAVTYAIVPLLSLVFFGERIQQSQIIGICMILAGVTLIGTAT